MEKNAKYGKVKGEMSKNGEPCNRCGSTHTHTHTHTLLCNLKNQNLTKHRRSTISMCIFNTHNKLCFFLLHYMGEKRGLFPRELQML